MKDCTFYTTKTQCKKDGSKMKKIRRLLLLALCLVLVCALVPQALADPALRAYCYNFQVTASGGVPTGFSFNLGAQYGTEPYELSYTISGGTSLSGTAAGNFITIPGTFASGTYTIDVTAKDAKGATSTAKMVATYTLNEDNSYGCSVSQSVSPEAVKVTKITLDKSAVTLRVGGSTDQLTVTVEPANATKRTVTYASSDTAVVTVSDAGVLTAVKAGSASVTVTATDGSGVLATCAVTVVQPVTAISLSPASATVSKGGTLVLSPAISPSDANNKTVTYTSSNESVAVVANNGTVTGVNNGVAVITVTSADDATKTATCTITVGVPVTGVSLSQNSAGLETGKTLALSASVKPDNATNQNVTWSTSDKTVATVSETGVVSTWKAGTATITATAADGSGKSAACTITVTGAEVTQPPTPTPTATPTPTPTGGSTTPTPTGSSTTPTPVPTGAPAGQTGYVQTEKGGLNLRANPSQSANRLDIIPENGSFTVITYGKTWCYVWYKGTYGYVMTKFVRLNSPAPTDTTPAGVTPSPAPDAPSGTTAFVYTEKGKLNLRSEPSENARILTRIPENGSFTVITYGNKWCYAWYKGTYGYVMTKFVRLAGATNMPSSTEKPGVTPAPATPTPALSGNQARVTTPKGDLNLRKEPDQSSSRILLIPRNAVVEVITKGSTWCYVRYNGRTGYVMTKFLTLGSGGGSTATPTPAPTVPVSDGTVKYAQVTTAKGGLNLRQGASQSYARILIIPRNAYVQVITYGKAWCYVQYNGRTGYVMTEFLKMI